MATKVMNGLDLQNQRITALADPTAATDAATKQYVDNLVSGLSPKDSVRVATTTNGALATAYANGQTVDGVVLATGNRILLKNQTTGSENGIYTVNSSGAPTRATDADGTNEMLGAIAPVEEGTTNADTLWICTTNAPITVGTTALAFTQWQSGIAYSAGNGLSLASTTFSVLSNGTSIDVSASGVKIADAAGGAGLTVAAGVLAVGAGTGITVAADTVAVDTSVIARKASFNVGNGSLTSVALTHNLGTKDVDVSVRDSATDAAVITDWVATDINTVTLTFAVAPGSNAYRATVIG